MRKGFWALMALALACGSASAAEPIITTIAGGGTPTSGVGDGGPGTQASMYEPKDVAVDAAGNIYIADSCRIRKLTPAGIITTVVGGGDSTKQVVNGGLATSGWVCAKTVAVDPFGNLWFDLYTRIGKMDPTGRVTYVAGSSTTGFSGDGGPATSAKLTQVTDIIFDAIGNAYIVDYMRIRKIATNGIITTIAGTGDYATGTDGDGGPASLASVWPVQIALDPFGTLYIADSAYDRVRKIDPATGVITSIWGLFPQFRSDPMALYTNPGFPTGIVSDEQGNLFVARQDRQPIAMIARDNAISMVVGPFFDYTFEDRPPPPPNLGDGGPASLAVLEAPNAITLDRQGNLIIADTWHNRVRKVTGRFTAPVATAGAWKLKPATPWRNESANQYSGGVAKGYFDNDKLLDLFVLAGTWDWYNPAPGDWNVYVYRQNPDGTLAAPVATPVPHVDVDLLMAVDLNHDRYTDLVFVAYDSATGHPNEGMFTMLGGPSGLSAPVRHPGFDQNNRPGGLAQADMDGDGNVDVLAVLSNSDFVGDAAWVVFYGDGNGGFPRKKRMPFAGASANVIRDFNGDGRPDMLWAHNDSQGTSGVMVAYHDGADGFLPPVLHPGPMPGYEVTIGDFDSDGRAEVIFSTDDNAPKAKLSQWAQGADGKFAFVKEWLTYDGATTVQAADVNGDERDDLLVIHGGWSSVGYAQQRFDGNGWGLDRETKSYAKFRNRGRTHDMTVGDFNNDGCNDVAVVNMAGGLQLLYGSTCIRVANGAKALSPPKKTGAPSGGLQQPQASNLSNAEVASTADKVWAASQTYAKATWTATVGTWSDTTRALVAAFSLLALGWWFLPFGMTWFKGRA